jgi:hypothetical protein
MLSRFLRSALPALLFGVFGSQLASADVYTWVDKTGTINVSNLAPPDGARVTSIIHASAPDAAAHEAARQAEVQALNERMRQLENEVERASRQAPPPDYRPVAAPPVMQYSPPVMQYFVNVAPQPEQYAVDPTQQAYAGCNPGWIGCGAWWAYPWSVVVVGAPNFRPTHPPRGQHDVTFHPPVNGQPPMHPPFSGQPPMHPPFAGQPPLPPPFAAQQPMSSPFASRKG